MSAPWKKGLLAVLCVFVVCVGLLCLAPVQTWVARRVLAGNPEYQAELQRVHIGWSGVTATAVRAKYSGAILTLPSLEADLSVLSAAFGDRIAVTRLVARGWTLDLTRYAPAQEVARGMPRGPEFSLLNSAYADATAVPVQTVFQGVFSQLQLPVDLSLDSAVLEGTIILPGIEAGPPLPVKVSFVGGGLRAGSESNFTLNARADFVGDTAPVNLLDIGGNLRAVMDSPRTFAKIALNLNAQASGGAFPQGVQLSAELAAARVSGGENYAVTLQSVGKRLLDVQANFPENSPRLGGVWRLDMRDTDVAPFVLGRRLPAFEAVGAGMFETDAAFAGVHSAGRIKSTVHRLEAVLPGWTDLGTITVFGEFDLTQQGSQTRVEKLDVEIARPDPVLAIRALQPFEFDAATGGLKVADPQGELLAVEARDMPLEWLQPVLTDIELHGEGLHGRLVAGARDGGMALRTTAPLRVGNFNLEQAHRLVLDQASLSTELSADYNPQGWQAALSNFKLSSRGETLIGANLRAGGLQSGDEPIKATGTVNLNLVPLSKQPPAAGVLALTGGVVGLDFSATVGATQELQASVKVSGLTAPEATLPVVESKLRASLDEAGTITFNVPLTVTAANPRRVSDLIVAGSLALDATGGRINARLGGRQIYLEDMQVLSMVLAAAPSADETASPGGADSVPFWNGWTGEVSLDVKSLFYTPQFELREVGGTMRLESGALKLDGIKAGAGEAGELNLQGAVNFDARSVRPYDLNADVKVKDFDAGPLFRALDPTRAPQIEGRFNLDSKLTGHGRNPVDLLDRTRGDAKLTSTGGVFRLLSADVSSKVEQAGKIAAVGAFIGNVAGVLGKGSKDAANFANKAQAVSEFSKLLTAISYDQLTVSIIRDDDLNTTLQNFSLISPEMRLTGKGGLTALEGKSFLEQPLSLDLQLKARGRTGSALQYLHVLADEPDALGYAVCTLPLKVGGTLLKPDTSELQSALLKLAVEQSGAGDLLNRLLGK